MSYKENDIVYEKGNYWILNDKSDKKKPCYSVYKNGLTHSKLDSAYPHDANGLSLAKARCDYKAKYDKS